MNVRTVLEEEEEEEEEEEKKQSCCCDCEYGVLEERIRI